MCVCVQHIQGLGGHDASGGVTVTNSVTVMPAARQVAVAPQCCSACFNFAESQHHSFVVHLATKTCHVIDYFV